MEMDQLVALCKRRGFLFQSSEIYGGLNGFWDYGPLGVELKRNIREAWWRDMVTSNNELAAPPGAPSAYEMAGLDCTIIMHPQVWKVTGHYDLFHDLMVDCRESKKRYRFDQVYGRGVEMRIKDPQSGDWVPYDDLGFVFVCTELQGQEALDDIESRARRFFDKHSEREGSVPAVWRRIGRRAAPAFRHPAFRLLARCLGRTRRASGRSPSRASST